MKNIISFCLVILLLAALPVYGKPPSLTPEQRENMVLYWNKLHTAVLEGDIKKINKYWAICLEKGVDPIGTVQNVKTVETVKALEKLGVDVTKRYTMLPYDGLPFRETMLECACLNGFSDVFEYLVKKDPSALYQQDEWMGCTPLQITIIGGSFGFVKHSRYKMVQQLLALGAPVDVVDRKGGETALLMAARRADVESFKVLLDAGASDTIKNKEGEGVDDYIKELEKTEAYKEEAAAMKQILADRRAARQRAEEKAAKTGSKLGAGQK